MIFIFAFIFPFITTKPLQGLRGQRGGAPLDYTDFHRNLFSGRKALPKEVFSLVFPFFSFFLSFLSTGSFFTVVFLLAQVFFL